MAKAKNNFYIVRSTGEKPWEVRNSDDPSLCWAKAETQEQAEEDLKECFTAEQVHLRFEDFVEKTASDLKISEEIVRRNI